MFSYHPSPFIQSIIDCYHQNGLVGEDRNITKVFLAAISKYLPTKYRTHIIVISESGAGKTTLLKTVLIPFDPDVKKYSRFTGAGLERKTESFDGKILLYEQMQGYEAGQMKLLMSEGELTILVSERDDHGKFASVEHTLKGMPVFMSTSTKPDLDVEMLNRVLLISLDESEAQTKRIIEKHASDFVNVSREEPFKKWSEISRLKSIYENIRKETIAGIKCPFADQIIERLPLPLNIRRDFLKLLNLTAIIAYSKIQDRPTIELSEVENVSEKIIVALPEDFHDALWCFGEGLIESFYHFIGKARDIYHILSNNLASNSEQVIPMTTREVAMKIGLGQKRAWAYLESLVDAGLATMTKEGRNNLYYPEKKEFEDVDLEVKFDEEDFERWIHNQFPDKLPEITVPGIAFNRKEQKEERANTFSPLLADRKSVNSVPNSPIRNGKNIIGHSSPEGLRLKDNCSDAPTSDISKIKAEEVDIQGSSNSSPAQNDKCAECGQPFDGVSINRSGDRAEKLICPGCYEKGDSKP